MTAPLRSYVKRPLRIFGKTIFLFEDLRGYLRNDLGIFRRKNSYRNPFSVFFKGKPLRSSMAIYLRASIERLLNYYMARTCKNFLGFPYKMFEIFYRKPFEVFLRRCLKSSLENPCRSSIAKPLRQFIDLEECFEYFYKETCIVLCKKTFINFYRSIGGLL